MQPPAGRSTLCKTGKTLYSVSCRFWKQGRSPFQAEVAALSQAVRQLTLLIQAETKDPGKEHSPHTGVTHSAASTAQRTPWDRQAKRHNPRAPPGELVERRAIAKGNRQDRGQDSLSGLPDRRTDPLPDAVPDFGT